MELQFIDAAGKFVLPELLDDQVHFRFTGLTLKQKFIRNQKAVAGGIILAWKCQTPSRTHWHRNYKTNTTLFRKKSSANYSFSWELPAENIDEIRTNAENVRSKNIYGSSTGNMLDALQHWESFFTLSYAYRHTLWRRSNYSPQSGADKEYFRWRHPCSPPSGNPKRWSYLLPSSSFAVSLAKQYNTRLHILHISTEKNWVCFANDIPWKKKE